MEQRRRKVQHEGQTYDGVDVSITSSNENWNEYLVSDGSVVRVKLVATEVIRLVDRYDADDNPVYLVRSTNIMTVHASEGLRRKQSGG